MTPARLRRELHDLTTQHDELEAQRQRLAEALQAALTADRDEFSAAAGIRSDLAAVTRRLHHVDERTAALAKLLPTPATVTEATKKVLKLQRTAADACASFHTEAAAFIEALDHAEAAARRLAAARTVARDCVAAILDTSNAAGLTTEAPAVPALAPPVEQVAHLQSVLLGECVFGEPDDVTERNLAAARAVADPLTAA